MRCGPGISVGVGAGVTGTDAGAVADGAAAVAVTTGVASLPVVGGAFVGEGPEPEHPATISATVRLAPASRVALE